MHSEFKFDQKDFRFHTDVQIRFNDIDILGHVNNTVYFSIFDTGKAYYFNAVKRGRMDWRKVETVIANINCSFISPVLFGQEVEVFTRCEVIHEKSFLLRQALVQKDTREVKALCDTVMVCMDLATGKSCSVPDDFRLLLNEYERRPLDAQNKD